MRRVGRLTVVLAAVLVACGGGESADRLPDVEVAPLVGGDTIQLSDIDGPAVINLWATWCAPCRAEIPDFESVHQERGDEVRFVGIAAPGYAVEAVDRAQRAAAERAATPRLARDGADFA